MAYFLSIYPHPTFHPAFRHSDGSIWSALYDSLRGVLPGRLADILPSPFSHFTQDTALTQPEIMPLSPRDMKLAVLLLSNRNSVSGVPKDTNNLLIFNNATNPKRY